MPRRDQLGVPLYRAVRVAFATTLALALLLALLLALSPAQAQGFVPSSSAAATAYLLMDADSGQLLVAQDIDAPREPASLAKMMTVYVAGQKLLQGAIFMTDEIRVSQKASRMTGSRMFLDLNSTVSVAALLHGIIVQSGNDASVALAEHVAGTEAEFVELMNRTARELGMTRTTFANATGLPARAPVQTTARDMATLSLALMRDHPYLYSLHSIRHFEHNNINQANRNRLLHRDPTVDGIKTGYTRAAGYCQTTSAVRGDMRLIAVVLGAGSTAARTRLNQELLDYGFSRYETHRLHVRGEPLGAIRVWKARQNELDYGLDTDIVVTIPRGRLSDLDRRVSLFLTEPVLGPMLRGQKVGELEIALGDQILAREDVFTLGEAAPAGFFSQVVDSVRLLLLRTNLL